MWHCDMRHKSCTHASNFSGGLCSMNMSGHSICVHWQHTQSLRNGSILVAVGAHLYSLSYRAHISSWLDIFPKCICNMHVSRDSLMHVTSQIIHICNIWGGHCWMTMYVHWQHMIFATENYHQHHHKWLSSSSMQWLIVIKMNFQFSDNFCLVLIKITFL